MKIDSVSDIADQCKQAFIRSLLHGSEAPLDKFSMALSEKLRCMDNNDGSIMTQLEEALANPECDTRSAEEILRDARALERTNATNNIHFERNPNRLKAIDAIKKAQDVIPNIKVPNTGHHPLSTLKQAISVSSIFAVSSYPLTLLIGTAGYTNEQIAITTLAVSATALQTFNALSYKWRLNRGLRQINRALNPK